MNKKIALKALLLSSPLLLTNAFANEQPQAEDLVGKFYGGAHLIHINTDNDRQVTPDPLKANDPYATVDSGSGFGGELGFRFTESTELRFSYSQINISKKNSVFDKPNVAELNALYFPTQQNFYVLAGLGALDVGQSDLSFNLGAGYRHYLNERMALYFEGKGHSQFSEDYKELSARFGFVYFFGGDTKSSPKKESKAAVAAAPVAAGQDSDNDGVVDSEDRCPNTPTTDKVDAKGCTLFDEEKSKMALLVNFGNNKTVVEDEYLPEIEKMVDFLKANPNTSLTIEGHTSKVGSAAYNQKISQQRSDAIVDIMINKFGIDSDRLSSVGYGEERLLDSGDNKAAHAKNRRIEAKIEVIKQVPVNR